MAMLIKSMSLCSFVRSARGSLTLLKCSAIASNGFFVMATSFKIALFYLNLDAIALTRKFSTPRIVCVVRK
ncbi:MAG: hypothetical protein CNIPEHKO_03565 [Anaerolineales bacterium]|nr:hypothetical protein [Anaerolineales bacterium]